jgi:hypothetical protein
MRKLTEGTYTIRFCPNVNNISENIIKTTKYYSEGKEIEESAAWEMRAAYFKQEQTRGLNETGVIKLPIKIDTYSSYAIINDGETEEFTDLQYGKSLFNAIQAPLKSSIIYYNDGRICSEIKRAKDPSSILWSRRIFKIIF